MKINRKLLVQCLEKVSQVLGGSTAPFDQKCFKISKNLILATNGMVTMKATLPILTDIECCVQGEPLLNLLKALNDEEVNLSFNKTGKEIHVITDKIEGKFVTAPFGKMDVEAIKDENDLISVDIKDFIDGLAACRHGVYKDKTLGAICGVRISDQDIISSNRSRIFKYRLSEGTDINCTLPVEFIDCLLKHKEEIAWLGYIKDLAIFKATLSDEFYTQITTVLLAGEYPDLGKYFNEQEDAKQESYDIKFVDDLKLAIDRQCNMLKDMDPADKETLVSINKEKCILSSIHPSLGVLREELAVTTSCQLMNLKIEFYVNPTIMGGAIGNCAGFKYYSNGLVLFENGSLKCLMQTRR